MRHWGPPRGGWHDRTACGSGWSQRAGASRRRSLDASSDQTASSCNPVDDDPKSKLRRTEAVLVLSRGPLTTRKLAALAGLADATEARTLSRQLNQLYDENDRAFRVEEVAGGYQLLTRPQFAPYLRRLGHVPQTIRLSSPAMETLAIVAYRQPVMRADIEAVRGVQSGELLRQLMERDLVRISGRSEELGRPYLYSTTKRFLQVFGLRNTEALPCADWFNEPELEENSGSESDSSPKESDVSIAIASDLETTEEPVASIAGGAPGLQAAQATSPSAVDDEEEWDEEDDEWDDDEEDEEGDWEDEDGEYEEDDEDAEEGEEEDWDEDEDEDYEDADDEDDGDWEEVDDEEGDEEWDEDDEEDEEFEEGEGDDEDGEWVEEEDDDDWEDDDEGEF